MAQLNYLQEPKNDPNAKSIADYVMPTPQPMKPSPVRATLPIPQTPAKAPVQPAGFHQTNYAPPMNVANPASGSNVSIADKLGLVQNIANKLDPVKRAANAFDGAIGKLGAPFADIAANTIAGAAGLKRPDSQGMVDSAVKYDEAINKPLLPAGSVQSGIKNALQNNLGWTPVANAAPASQPAPTAAPKSTPAQPAETQNANGLTVTPKIDAAYQPQGLPPETGTTAQNAKAKPAPTNTGIPKPSKPAKAGKPSANPTMQQQAQPPAQAPVDVGADPFESYKARTGIDLSNTSLAPVPSYVQRVDQTQGMDFQNGQRANANGSAVVPVETQEQFNQRWAMVNDFYNSPEGQALVAARQQGDVVEVQRGDQTSFADFRNGGDKGIQDYIADQAAKDSALAKSPTDGMNNRELNQLDLLKPKLASETDIAQTGIAANASRDVASINNRDEAVKTALLQEYMNPKTDPKRREQLAPLFAGKDNKEIVVQGGEVYNEESGQMQKIPSYVYDPSIKDYRYPNGTNPNAAAKPSLSQFMAKAKLANPDYSDAELRTIYTEKYGK